MTLPLPLRKPLTLAEALHLAAPVTGPEPEQSLDRLLLAVLLCATSTSTINWTGTLDALMTGRRVMVHLTEHSNRDIREYAQRFKVMPPRDITALTIRVATRLRGALHASEWTVSPAPDWKYVTTFDEAYALAARLMPFSPSPHLPDIGAISLHMLSALIFAVSIENPHPTTSAFETIYLITARGSGSVHDFLTRHPDWRVHEHASAALGLPQTTQALVTAHIAGHLASHLYRATTVNLPSLPASHSQNQKENLLRSSELHKPRLPFLSKDLKKRK